MNYYENEQRRMRNNRRASLGSLMVDIPGLGARMPNSYLRGLGDATQSGSGYWDIDGNSINMLDPAVLTQIATGILQVYDQQQLFQLNLDRASRGLPPINVQSLQVPQPGVQVGLSSQTMLLIGAAILAAFLLAK